MIKGMICGAAMLLCAVACTGPALADTLGQATNVCANWVQQGFPSFDAYVDAYGTVHMIATERETFFFDRCMDHMGHTLHTLRDASYGN